LANYSSRAQKCALNIAIKSRPFVVTDKEYSINCIFNFYPIKKARSENEAYDGNTWSGLFLGIGSKAKFDGIYHIGLAILEAGAKIFRALPFSQGNSISYIYDWGFDEFIRHPGLENPSNNLLPDDKLTILRRIEKTNEDSKQCDCPNEDVQTRRRLVEDYATLLKKETISDVNFIVKNLKIPEHKVILAARSPVLAAMFQNERKGVQ